MAKTDRKLEKIAELVGNIGRNQGDIAEEFFYNSLAEHKTLGGIHYDFIDKNVSRSGSGVADEFDIVLVNGQDVAIIEVKYKAHEKDLDKLITKKIKNFKTLFPMYREYTHHLVLASFYMYDLLKEKALENNVMVLQRKGRLIESFEPI